MNQPLWSLSYEVWFYVLNGAVAVLLSGRSKAWAFAVLCASLACFAFLQLEYLVIWYLGALLFLVSGGKPSGARLFAVLVVTAAAVAFWELLGARLPVLVSFMFVCAAMLLIRELAALRPKPNLLVKLGSRLAGFSYSLYLIHYPLLVIIDQLAPRSHAINAYSLGLYFLRVGVSVAGGYVFYLCFERHTPRVRRWLRDISESPTRRDGRETTKSALGSEETAPESDVLGRT
jgi:peptidoglycan/LPS O-acetylase OafA/YrhL